MTIFSLDRNFFAFNAPKRAVVSRSINPTCRSPWMSFLYSRRKERRGCIDTASEEGLRLEWNWLAYNVR